MSVLAISASHSSDVSHAQAITRSSVYNNPNVTCASIAALAGTRRGELRVLRQATLGIQILPPTMSTYPNKTVADVVNQFMAAGAITPYNWNISGSTPTLPDSNSSALGDLRTEYNLVTWTGNTTAYLQCNLAVRAPNYLGICVPMNVSCAVTNNDTYPYNCTDLTTTPPTNITGTMSSASYRVQCEMPCNNVVDCSTICECWGSCKRNQVCMCAACMQGQMNIDATLDQEFQDVITTSGLTNASSYIAIVSSTSGRRQLLQTLTDVMTQVSAVQQSQTALAAQTAALQLSVDKSNALATARASDPTLVNLISQGQASIANNQKAIMDQLAVIIGKQNQSLAAAQTAASALSAIQGLAQLQAQAQQALISAVQTQVTAIKSATFAKIITLTQVGRKTRGEGRVRVP